MTSSCEQLQDASVEDNMEIKSAMEMEFKTCDRYSKTMQTILNNINNISGSGPVLSERCLHI